MGPLLVALLFYDFVYDDYVDRPTKASAPRIDTLLGHVKYHHYLNISTNVAAEYERLQQATRRSYEALSSLIMLVERPFEECRSGRLPSVASLSQSSHQSKENESISMQRWTLANDQVESDSRKMDFIPTDQTPENWQELVTFSLLLNSEEQTYAMKPFYEIMQKITVESYEPEHFDVLSVKNDEIVYEFWLRNHEFFGTQHYIFVVSKIKEGVMSCGYAAKHILSESEREEWLLRLRSACEGPLSLPLIAQSPVDNLQSTSSPSSSPSPTSDALPSSPSMAEIVPSSPEPEKEA